MRFNTPASGLINDLVINHKASVKKPAPKQEEAIVDDSAGLTVPDGGSAQIPGTVMPGTNGMEAPGPGVVSAPAPMLGTPVDEPKPSTAADVVVENATVGISPVVVLDDADSVEDLNPAADYTATDIALKAAASVQEWAETSSDDLDAGEGIADRLFGLLAGIADENMDGEISEDEQNVLVMACEAAWDYMAEKGVSDDDCSKLLNDWDNDVASRVQEVVATSLPDGDAAIEDIDSFAFGDEAEEAALDAVYKKRFVVRKGKKVRINKRVSGKVRLSAKQKMSIRKAGMKSHRAGAQVRRAKSVKIRKKMGL